MNNYLYANGVIKSLENKILSKDKIYRFTSLNSNELVKALYDAGIGNNTSSLDNLLVSDEIIVRDVIRENSPTQKFTDLLFLQNDALNLKIAYKNKLFNKNVLLTNDFGSINPNLIKDAIDKGCCDNSIYLDYIVKTINKKISKELSSGLLSSIIDNVLLEYCYKLSIKESKVLSSYFLRIIDNVKIMSVFRAKQLNIDLDYLLSTIPNGGSINNELISKYYNKDVSFIVDSFKSCIDNKLFNVLKDYSKNMDLSKLSRNINQYHINKTLEDKFDSFGIGVILSYFVMKNAQRDNIRMVSTNKMIDMNELYSY